MQNIGKKTLVSLLCGLLFTGCWDENSDHCGPDKTVEPTLLQFSYDLHTQGADRFLQEVEHLRLYIFDRGNRFLQTMEVPVQALDENQRLALSLEEGEYTVVAWGNTHSGSFRFTPEEVLRTIDQLRMQLISDGEETVVSSVLPGIFHGSASIRVAEGGVYPVRLTKNTNQVHVMLTLPGSDREFYTLDDLELGVRLVGHNGTYGHDNRPIAENPVTYLPYRETKYANNSLLVSMNTLRLTPESDLKLTIWETWRPIYKNKPADDLLLNYLLAELDTKDVADYLDRNEEWIIEFELEETDTGYVAVRFYLRDWNELKDWDVIIPPGKL